MKLTIEQSVLSEKLKQVMPFVATKSPLPIRQYVLLQTGEDGLILAAHNGEAGISLKATATIKEPGSIAVPGVQLNNTVNGLDSGLIELSLNGTRLTLKQGKTKPTISGLEGEQFTSIPQIPESEPIVLPLPTLAGMISGVLFACSLDESRPTFTGVNIRIEGGILSLTSADGQRGAYIEAKVESESELDIVVPILILKQLTSLAIGEVKIYLGEKQIIVSQNDIVMTSQTIEGKFPRMTSFLDLLKEAKTFITFDKDSFKKKLNLCMIYSKESKGEVMLSIQDEEVLINSPKVTIGEHEDSLSCGVEGDKMIILANCQHLIDALGVLTTPKGKMYLVGPRAGAIIRDENDNLFTVTMLFSS